MLNAITLGPRLSRITGRYDAAEKAGIQQERDQMISDILLDCAEATRQFVSVEDYAAMPEHAAKTSKELFAKAILQMEPYDDFTFTSFLHRMTDPVHMTLDLAHGIEAMSITAPHAPVREGQCLKIDLTSANKNFNISSFFYVGDTATQALLHTYWDKQLGTEKLGTSPDAWESFDRARKEVHNEAYQIFQTAFWNIGMYAGMKLSTKLFGLLALTYPSDKNPMPSLAASRLRF